MISVRRRLIAAIISAGSANLIRHWRYMNGSSRRTTTMQRPIGVAHCADLALNMWRILHPSSGCPLAIGPVLTVFWRMWTIWRQWRTPMASPVGSIRKMLPRSQRSREVFWLLPRIPSPTMCSSAIRNPTKTATAPGIVCWPRIFTTSLLIREERCSFPASRWKIWREPSMNPISLRR